tara:strand:- start:37 stop:912 length:876 start_codon:yes stop_codon:yes gene_type:complete
MKKLNLFCFGFGQVAKNFVKRIIKEKIDINLITTTRDEKKTKIFEDLKYQNFQLEENKFDKFLVEKLKLADHILISIPPVNNEDVVIKNLKEEFKNLNIKWITYLSATSVYGDHDGNWVDESSSTKPTSVNGVARLKAENSWIKLSKEFNLPLQIFRLSGIYSNDYNVLKRLKLGQVKIINKTNHYFSRIHVEDIANALFISLNKFKNGEIFNISDNRPASNEDVIMHGVKLLGLKKPKTIEINEIESQMLKNFYNDSKKVKNNKMKEFFKLKLKHPSYVEGLNNIFNNFI